MVELARNMSKQRVHLRIERGPRHERAGDCSADLAVEGLTTCHPIRAHGMARKLLMHSAMRRTWIIMTLMWGCVPAGKVGTEIASTSQWLCSADSAALSCRAAMPAKPGESGAYACVLGDSSDACPPELVPESVAGLNELLSAYQFDDVRLAEIPWACLLTGNAERDCIKSVKRAADKEVRTPDPGTGEVGGDDGDVSPSDDVPTPTDPGTVDGTPDDGVPDDGQVPDEGHQTIAEEPAPPANCEPQGWEGYFQQRATYSYQQHGVDIVFPREIFDVTANFNDLAIASGFLPDNPGAPSCHDGEWAMREDAWLDATMEGCMGLDQAILVMCQQAANYAPTAGACNATGSW